MARLRQALGARPAAAAALNAEVTRRTGLSLHLADRVAQAVVRRALIEAAVDGAKERLQAKGRDVGIDVTEQLKWLEELRRFWQDRVEDTRQNAGYGWTGGLLGFRARTNYYNHLDEDAGDGEEPPTHDLHDARSTLEVESFMRPGGDAFWLTPRSGAPPVERVTAERAAITLGARGERALTVLNFFEKQEMKLLEMAAPAREGEDPDQVEARQARARSIRKSMKSLQQNVFGSTVASEEYRDFMASNMLRGPLSLWHYTEDYETAGWDLPIG